ncbi:MAG: diguanylate cyclase, partial [Myxococcota bacterium]
SCAPIALEDIAERLRQSVEELELEGAEGSPLAVTVSVGGAAFQGTDPGGYADLVARADAALYRAKEGGRNRSVLAA